MQEQAGAAAPAQAPLLLLTQAPYAGLAAGDSAAAAAAAADAPGPSRSQTPALTTPGKHLGRKVAGSAGPALRNIAEAPVDDEDARAAVPGGADSEPALQLDGGGGTKRKRRAGSGDGGTGKAAAKAGSKQQAKRRRAEVSAGKLMAPDGPITDALSLPCLQRAPAQARANASAAVAAVAGGPDPAASAAEPAVTEPSAEQQAAGTEHERAAARSRSAPLARRQGPAAADSARRRRELLGPVRAPKVVLPCALCRRA